MESHEMIWNGAPSRRKSVTPRAKVCRTEAPRPADCTPGDAAKEASTALTRTTQRRRWVMYTFFKTVATKASLR
jgi:hypothetical protein